MKPKIETCSKCHKDAFVWKRVNRSPVCRRCCVSAIKKVSDKQKSLNTKYLSIRKKFMIDNPDCQASLDGCTIVATECHHSAGRIGDRMLNVETFIALCHNCHMYIHDKMSASDARSLGFKK